MTPRETCLAVMDILGFGNMIRSEIDIERFKQQYMAVFTDRLVHEKAEAFSCSYEIFSDTVIIGAGANNRMQQVFHLVSFTRFLWTWGIMHDFPLRGALAYGRVLWADDVKVGTPIVEAAHAERFQEWIGVVLCPSLGGLIVREGGDFRQHLERDHIILTDIPVKSGGHLRAFALRPDVEGVGTSVEALRARLEKQLLYCEEIPAQGKYRNTFAFLDKCQASVLVK